jgi:hypothetical protein
MNKYPCLNKYPCKDCLIKGVCSKLCDKVLDSDFIFEFILKNRHCPDCRCEKVIHCGGENLSNNTMLIDSCTSCIECGSLYFTVVMNDGRILLRNRKYVKNVVKDINDHLVMTFWYYLKSCGLITYREYYR